MAIKERHAKYYGFQEYDTGEWMWFNTKTEARAKAKKEYEKAIQLAFKDKYYKANPVSLAYHITDLKKTYLDKQGARRETLSH